MEVHFSNLSTKQQISTVMEMFTHKEQSHIL